MGRNKERREEEKGERVPVGEFGVNPLKEYEAIKAMMGEGAAAEERQEEVGLKKVEESEEGGDEDMDVVIPYIDKHKPVEVACPYFLNLDLEDEAEKLVRKAQSRVESEGKADKDEIKKRIIELTKELLTSKDAREKEEIRKQIKELKSMLGVVSRGKKPKAIAFLEEDIMDELSKRLEEFLANVKTYKKSIENSYQQAKVLAKGDEKERKVEELYKKDMEELKTQTLSCGERVKDYLMRLYLKAIELVEGEESDKAALRQKVEEKLKLFQGQLSRLFGEPIRTESKTVEKKEAAKPEEEAKDAFQEYERAIKEVEELKETELLHFLHSHDRKAFMEYIRGALDKEKALLYAKRLYAIKVKNVPEHIVNKYYEEVEV